ncbi:branched-chain amino acid aminotransferase [Cutibacterium acnes JCM 18920]|nr:branched-chain amino acid aminotransferase [Cutibacterium acnes JCM 18920]
MIAYQDFLGLAAASTVLFSVIGSPVGAYFVSGVKPLRLLVERRQARTAPGGTGEAKCGGNYAASLRSQIDARPAAATRCSLSMQLNIAGSRSWVV